MRSLRPVPPPAPPARDRCLWRRRVAAPTALAVRPGDLQLLCGTEDGTLTLWSADGEPLGALQLGARVHAVGFCAQGGAPRYLAALADGRLVLCDPGQVLATLVLPLPAQFVASWSGEERVVVACRAREQSVLGEARFSDGSFRAWAAPDPKATSA